jgi:hypothetical protein
MFDQRTLVLEGIALTQEVQFVVQVLVDLARGTVFDEEAAKDSEAAHPQDLAKGPEVRRLFRKDASTRLEHRTTTTRHRKGPRIPGHPSIGCTTSATAEPPKGGFGTKY